MQIKWFQNHKQDCAIIELPNTRWIIMTVKHGCVDLWVDAEDPKYFNTYEEALTEVESLMGFIDQKL